MDIRRDKKEKERRCEYNTGRARRPTRTLGVVSSSDSLPALAASLLPALPLRGDAAGAAGGAAVDFEGGRAGRVARRRDARAAMQVSVRQDTLGTAGAASRQEQHGENGAAGTGETGTGGAGMQAAAWRSSPRGTSSSSKANVSADVLKTAESSRGGDGATLLISPKSGDSER